MAASCTRAQIFLLMHQRAITEKDVLIESLLYSCSNLVTELILERRKRNNSLKFLRPWKIRTKIRISRETTFTLTYRGLPNITTWKKNSMRKPKTHGLQTRMVTPPSVRELALLSLIQQIMLVEAQRHLQYKATIQSCRICTGLDR